MYLYGASGHCKVIVDILKAQNVEIQAILDDFPKSESLLSMPVKKTSDQILLPTDEVVVSIGDNSIRKKVAERLQVIFGNAVHPSAVVSSFSSIKQGTVVMPNAVINSGSIVGKHCIVNSGAVIEHDCILEDFVHVSPNAALAGGVTIGEGSHVGIGAAVIQGVTIGKWVTVGAGAVIIDDLPDFAVVVGNPGKVIKFTNPQR
ncbi:acetyltransferase [Flavobacterium sp. SM15]|uniref:acetyltransferase n=1 Tax=Flavobacterium sp. SM15 TaxID=2908005 RepID=UPI001EDB838A|nr:acetyltransferase [Flavobacterium sp. SM15]MCG2611277.1 acetyltransferase [Flavobacterium sp. SM15]